MGGRTDGSIDPLINPPTKLFPFTFHSNAHCLLFQLPGKIRTESGKPGDVIIQTACQEKAGLIVIGSRGQGKLKRTMSGSVSDYVLHHSKCPVVICTQRD